MPCDSSHRTKVQFLRPTEKIRIKHVMVMGLTEASDQSWQCQELESIMSYKRMQHGDLTLLHRWVPIARTGGPGDLTWGKLWLRRCSAFLPKVAFREVSVGLQSRAQGTDASATLNSLYLCPDV